MKEECKRFLCRVGREYIAQVKVTTMRSFSIMSIFRRSHAWHERENIARSFPLTLVSSYIKVNIFGLDSCFYFYDL